MLTGETDNPKRCNVSHDVFETKDILSLTQVAEKLFKATTEYSRDVKSLMNTNEKSPQSGAIVVTQNPGYHQ